MIAAANFPSNVEGWTNAQPVEQAQPQGGYEELGSSRDYKLKFIVHRFTIPSCRSGCILEGDSGQTVHTAIAEEVILDQP
jgi:hypothetical protein